MTEHDDKPKEQAPNPASAEFVGEYRALLTKGEDVIDPQTWAGSLPAAYGIAPRLRVGANRWFNLLWLVPIGLGLLLVAWFAAWVGSAQAIYTSLYGPKPPASALGFIQDVLTTDRGWWLIVVGGLVGFVFAAVALAVSVFSFPLLLDRDCGVFVAVRTSLRATRENPVAVALWGLIVAVGLILGSLPLFLGLVIVMPVLGHGTWRFYRRAIERDPAHEHPAPPSDAAVPPPSVYPKPHSFLFPS